MSDTEKSTELIENDTANDAATVQDENTVKKTTRKRKPKAEATDTASDAPLSEAANVTADAASESEATEAQVTPKKAPRKRKPKAEATDSASDAPLFEAADSTADAPSESEATATDEPFADTVDGAAVSEAVISNEDEARERDIASDGEISAQPDTSDEVVVDNASDAYGIYEISFFGPDTEQMADDAEGKNYSEPSGDPFLDENQLSFFEDEEPQVKIPEAPVEIPLFIPKEPKRGAVLKKSPYNPEKPRGVDTLFDFVELFIISLVCVLIVTSFFFRHSKVVGDSMMNTLYDEEHLIISDAFYTPKRGDIVVIEDKSINLSGASDAHYALVKRVIAVAGDHVVVNTAGQVYLNGQRLTEDYVFTDGAVHSRYIDMTVPEGEIFVLGDHRNNSTDSRYFGTVRVDCVIGRALIRVYPFERFGRIE